VLKKSGGKTEGRPGGLPQGWIIDARGRRSSPFRMPSVERAIQELEKAAAAK
jgi:hypothetical protein